MLKKTTKLLVTSALIAGLATVANAAEKVKWTLATTWGSTLNPFIDAPVNMAKLVEEMSDGRFKIRIDAANKHKSPLGILDMVKGGQYDMGHSASYYWKGKDVELLPFTTMPFGMTAPEQYAWFYYGGGMELMQKAYKKHGVLSFPGGNTGNQMGGWFRKEINSLDDLKGLKMRIPGFAGEVMAKLGLTVTNIAPGELYTSLERGTIDALEWVGPGMDINMGFHKIAPYYYTGWHEPATELQFLINEKSYAKLPKDLQQILLTAMRVSAYDMYIQNYHMSSEAWDTMLKEYPNIKVKTFPKPVMDAMKKANDELLTELKAQSPLLKETLESQEAYQKKSRKWTEMSDYLYLKDNL
ncbi:MAG: TRAP transporter substrate-binding protein [Arcobacter sp.]|jgi:TRAP-type mannitol/chloroaromatic compound transport system substrate-binding protein|uniref:TRAP transporter, substrate binding protein, DctP family n=1 Tax=Arcobacter defluvii TaxID=873191 RepID=A0AAE7BBI0_9BACT|nr:MULTISPECIES: TRAP transporter substrate-binding protein DctP [Arcobacter]MDY3200181.1 TRAP transporter substrate-binding protein DctP [Arcobacter sp.]QKF76183.1 TRAP transporter, substrate binding protein, DctP family [Arcobacter defluvii]RXI32337.1 ABC transporter substrate-binding protein [Arcobacter defluvii]BAK71978.1 TRAP dicarboxylate ABC transporter substrate binding component [Arcobacter sp. L]